MTRRHQTSDSPGASGPPLAGDAIGRHDAQVRHRGWSAARSVGTWLYVKYRATRLWGHRWLVERPSIHGGLHVMGALKTGAEPVARGIAIGLFIGLTPTVGVQILLMIAACVVLRGNFLAAFAVSFISNPFTLPVLYWLFHVLGDGALSVAGLSVVDDASSALNGFGDEVLSAAIGSLLIATPAAMAGYFATHWVVALRERLRHRRKKPS